MDLPKILDPDYVMCSICSNCSLNSDNTIQCDLDPHKVGMPAKNYDCGEFKLEGCFLVAVLVEIIKQMKKEGKDRG